MNTRKRKCVLFNLLLYVLHIHHVFTDVTARISTTTTNTNTELENMVREVHDIFPHVSFKLFKTLLAFTTSHYLYACFNVRYEIKKSKNSFFRHK